MDAVCSFSWTLQTIGSQRILERKVPCHSQSSVRQKEWESKSRNWKWQENAAILPICCSLYIFAQYILVLFFFFFFIIKLQMEIQTSWKEWILHFGQVMQQDSYWEQLCASQRQLTLACTWHSSRQLAKNESACSGCVLLKLNIGFL